MSLNFLIVQKNVNDDVSHLKILVMNGIILLPFFCHSAMVSFFVERVVNNEIVCYRLDATSLVYHHSNSNI